MESILYFVYFSAKEIISVQAISNISQNEDYLQGISVLYDDKGSLKTFRKDRVIEYLDSLEEAKEFLLDCCLSDFTVRKPKTETFDIHFTGFKKADKEELERIATDANMEVRKSVTKNLNLLCYGYNASQMKMDKARSMGIIILNESQFRNFLETGDFTDSK